jgi:hypothetical protein
LGEGSLLAEYQRVGVLLHVPGLELGDSFPTVKNVLCLAGA